MDLINIKEIMINTILMNLLINIIQIPNLSKYSKKEFSLKTNKLVRTNTKK